MNDKVTIAQNDYGQALTRTIYDSNGTTAFDLTGYTINLKVWSAGSEDSPIATIAASIVVAANGTISCVIPASTFTTTGKYLAEWELTTGSSRLSTEPFDLIVKESA